MSVTIFPGDVGVTSNLTAHNINFTGTFYYDGQEFQSSPWTTDNNDLSYTSGNVGIGRTNPQSLLHVDGDVRMKTLSTDVITKITPVYARGTGNNNSANRLVKIGDSEVVNNNTRGLTLTIINATTHQHVSSTNYDTYTGSSVVSSFSAALEAMTDTQIGVITSYDAFESSYTIGNSALKLGLSRLSYITSNDGIRHPYVAIFYGGGASSIPGNHAIEVMKTNDALGAYATLSTFLVDDSFMGQAVTNALYTSSGDSTSPAVLVDGNGNVGIGTTYVESLLHLTKSTGNTTVNPVKMILEAKFDYGGTNITDPYALLEFQHDTSGSNSYRGAVGRIWTTRTRTDNRDYKFCIGARTSPSSSSFSENLALFPGGSVELGGALTAHYISSDNIIQTSYRIGINAYPNYSLEMNGGNAYFKGSDGLGIYLNDNYYFVNSSGNGSYAWQGYPGVVRVNGNGEFRVHGTSSYNVAVRADGGFATFTGCHDTYNYFDEYDAGKIVCATGNYESALKTGVYFNEITLMDACPIVSLCVKENDKRVIGVLSIRDLQSRKKEITQEEFELLDDISKKAYTKESNVYITDEQTNKFSKGLYNALGEGGIWVSNKNGNLENGDYITSSTIPGYGQKQDDDILRNYTVAKITCDCDFKEYIETKRRRVQIGNNYQYDENNQPLYEDVLDENGNIVTHSKLKLRYLLPDGTEITKEQYALEDEAYIAAFVGCTYHCG